MQTAALSQTVRELLQPTELLTPADSLDRAAAVMRHATGAFVPVVDGYRLLGAVTEARMAGCLANGCVSTDSVVEALDSHIMTIPPYATGAEALRVLTETGVPALAVVDDVGRVMGLIEPTDLFPRPQLRPALGAVGGMATPFGVHLTTGVVSAGVPHLAIVSTGALLCLLFVASTVATRFASIWMWRHHMPAVAINWVENGLPLLLFLIGMRILPISGIHGAEHKVVHALERGEELVPEVVRRMPRIHPRCGTNLAAGASLFLMLSTLNWSDFIGRAAGRMVDEVSRVLIAGLVTLFFWHRIGSFLQRYATTKRPSDRQLAMGIKSGRELLDRVKYARRWTPTLWQRIWHSGMIHVAFGSTSTFLIVHVVLAHFGHADWLLV